MLKIMRNLLQLMFGIPLAIIRDLSKRFHLLLGSDENDASDYTSEILPDIRQEKAERSAKISELLTEV
jgi:hypothetical protein